MRNGQTILPASCPTYNNGAVIKINPEWTTTEWGSIPQTLLLKGVLEMPERAFELHRIYALRGCMWLPFHHTCLVRHSHVTLDSIKWARKVWLQRPVARVNVWVFIPVLLHMLFLYLSIWKCP